MDTPAQLLPNTLPILPDASWEAILSCTDANLAQRRTEGFALLSFQKSCSISAATPQRLRFSATEIEEVHESVLFEPIVLRFMQQAGICSDGDGAHGRRVCRAFEIYVEAVVQSYGMAEFMSWFNGTFESQIAAATVRTCADLPAPQKPHKRKYASSADLPSKRRRVECFVAAPSTLDILRLLRQRQNLVGPVIHFPQTKRHSRTRTPSPPAQPPPPLLQRLSYPPTPALSDTTTVADTSFASSPIPQALLRDAEHFIQETIDMCLRGEISINPSLGRNTPVRESTPELHAREAAASAPSSPEQHLPLSNSTVANLPTSVASSSSSPNKSPEQVLPASARAENSDPWAQDQQSLQIPSTTSGSWSWPTGTHATAVETMPFAYPFSFMPSAGSWVTLPFYWM
ncbi:hypothetical protein MKEN_00365600 [Mycena kentingensis (nom. inval.)]|nr:hypothetical protein MKEN_00365600 [Mycena kentingensis (nom. inval.)]